MSTRVTVKYIAPEEASKLLCENVYHHQRTVRYKHVLFLSTEMRRGTFKQDTTIELSHVNGETYVTDGQHRLSAVVHSGQAQRFVVVERDADSEDLVAQDYVRTDKGLRRSIGDDYIVLGLDEVIGLSPTKITKVGAAVTFMYSGFKSNRSSMPSSNRISWVREYGDAAEYYDEIVTGHTSDMTKRIWRVSTLSVGLVTCRFSVKVFGHDLVRSFWHGVATGEDISKGDPRQVAFRHLLIYGVARGGATSQTTRSDAYAARYLAQCFNAYAEGRTLQGTKVYDANSPIAILGSPYNGNQ